MNLSIDIQLNDCLCYSHLQSYLSCQQDMITLTKLVMDKIFHGLLINTLKNFLKIFESKGLTWIQGKNVSVITKQMHAAVVSLDEVNALSVES